MPSAESGQYKHKISNSVPTPETFSHSKLSRRNIDHNTFHIFKREISRRSTSQVVSRVSLGARQYPCVQNMLRQRTQRFCGTTTDSASGSGKLQIVHLQRLPRFQPNQPATDSSDTHVMMDGSSMGVGARSRAIAADPALLAHAQITLTK